MAYKYYYIDDDSMETIKEIAKGLSSFSEQLEVEPYQHKIWSEELSFLLDNQEQYNGLILDWSLTRKNQEGEEADFDVEALAQQLRKYAVEKRRFKKSFPIILCSAKLRFRQVFEKESTTHDLFDGVYEKEQFSDDKSNVTRELISLAHGYETMNDKLKYSAPLNSSLQLLGEKDQSPIDVRVVTHLRKLIDENKPGHVIARFILESIVKPNGILVDKYLLASRLGLDVLSEDGHKAFEKFKKKIEKLSYSGIFGDGWERWWMSKISDWWDDNFENNLGDISGPDKVELLNKKFKASLIPAEKTGKSVSNYFWVTCFETNRPISIKDSVLKEEKSKNFDWIEDEYFSIEAALEKEQNELNILERERIKKLKKMFEKVR